MPLKALLRIAAILSPIMVAAMSWLPFDAMVKTGFSQPIEHVLAYFGSGVLLRGAWPRLGAGRLLAALALMAGVLEIGQIWLPGRSAQFDDFAFGLLGTGLALTIGPITTALRSAQPDAIFVRRSGSEPEPERAERATSLAQLGLLSLLVLGGVLTLVWTVSLVWAVYLVGRWLFD